MLRCACCEAHRLRVCTELKVEALQRALEQLGLRAVRRLKPEQKAERRSGGLGRG